MESLIENKILNFPPVTNILCKVNSSTKLVLKNNKRAK